MASAGRQLMASLLLALGVAGVAGVHANDTGDNSPSSLRLSGFGTLGLSHTRSDHDWLLAREQTQVGASSASSALVDSRLGLQLNWAPAERWDTALQLVLRQRAKDASLGEAVEWAFVGYQISADWHLRLGRTSPDVFLQADLRNVGYALPWVRPNIEFYGWMPINSLDGADLSHIWHTEHADWTAKVQLGNGLNTIQALRIDDSLRIRNRNTAVLTLSREAGHWLIKASYARADIHVKPNANLRLLQQALQQITALPVPSVAQQAQNLSDDLYPQGLTQYASLGLQYQSSTWFGSAEASHVHLASGLSAGWRGYASLGRRWQRLSAYLIAGRSQADKMPNAAPLNWQAELTPVIGAPNAAMATGLGTLAAEAANTARFEQSSIGLGLRYDFAPRMALKLQVDQVNTQANGAGSWRHNTSESGSSQIYSATLDFVF
ncbi:hypothetical protein [Roseateles sp. PN1]|uniref:hypothetical protein n=1 Tax=Roseateles sp. PN1 TaxID=3137372 RepID=UPI003138FB9B